MLYCAWIGHQLGRISSPPNVDKAAGDARELLLGAPGPETDPICRTRSGLFAGTRRRCADRSTSCLELTELRTPVDGLRNPRAGPPLTLKRFECCPIGRPLIIGAASAGRVSRSMRGAVEKQGTLQLQGKAMITRRAHCACLAVRKKKGTPVVPNMHIEAQDQSAAGWGQVANMIAQLAHTSVTILEPAAQIPSEDWMRVITLPPEVAHLTQVKEVRLYGSHLRRLPPEIGRMSSLRELDIYTSYALHWLPYEVTRCANLTASRMSTRGLYGNRNTRLPFPRLSSPIDVLLPTTCSVCDRRFGDRTPQLFWTTQRVGTDFVPLLIHSCSSACINSVPSAPSGFFERPHKGGGGVGMPIA